MKQKIHFRPKLSFERIKTFSLEESMNFFPYFILLIKIKDFYFMLIQKYVLLDYSAWPLK